MKVTINQAPSFQPIEVMIKLETKAELEALHTLVAHGPGATPTLLRHGMICSHHVDILKALFIELNRQLAP